MWFINSRIQKHFFPYFFSSINKPTRVTNPSVFLIDNIYYNVPIQRSHHHAGVLTVSISDHSGIFRINNSSKIHNKNTQIVKEGFLTKILQTSNNVYYMNCRILFT